MEFKIYMSYNVYVLEFGTVAYMVKNLDENN
jgi:hypothetical protein